MKNNIILTGNPKSGKSTLLRKIINTQPNIFGFITNEILENNERVGFEMENHYGDKNILSHINFNTDIKVGKYFVNLQNLEKGLEGMKDFNPKHFLYLDEIGKMQIYSKEFQKLTLKYLNSLNICLATMKKDYNHKFIEHLKQREDIMIIELKKNNREEKEEEIKRLIKNLSF